MSSRAALASAMLPALLLGCALDANDGNDVNDVNGASGPFTSAWVEVGAAQFGSDGETSAVAIAVQDPSVALALRASTTPGMCFQLSSAVDGLSRSAVAGRSAGAFCEDCELRTSVAATAGVFMVPTDVGRFEPWTGVSLQFAQVDCTTLTPVIAPKDRPFLHLAMQSIPTASALATIDLRFHIARSSLLFGDDNRQQELVAHLTEALSTSGIEPRLIDSRTLETLPTTITFHAGDPTALAAVLANAPPKAETTIDVVFGGCLLYDDPIFGPPKAVNGFTPRIPGGAGPADAVFVPGLDCFKENPDLLNLPISAQARILAHELGHYLGLYHTVEKDGGTDQLDDTDQDNIMFSNPQQANAIGFSPAQGRVMRMHPAVRAR